MKDTYNGGTIYSIQLFLYQYQYQYGYYHQAFHR
jgi:hypothetical protein